MNSDYFLIYPHFYFELISLQIKDTPESIGSASTLREEGDSVMAAIVC